MDDVATAKSENENLRKIRTRLLQWEAKGDPLAPLNIVQEECCDAISNIWSDEPSPSTPADASDKPVAVTEIPKTEKYILANDSLRELLKLHEPGIDNINDFLLWFDQVHAEIYQQRDITFQRYLQQLESRNEECRNMLDQIDGALKLLSNLSEEYALVSEKTGALNASSEQLTEEQEKLQRLSEEIQRRLHYFNQVELLHQRLLSPTIAVTSEAFRECLTKIDECLAYLQENSKFKDSAAFTVKYKHCLARAVSLIKGYTSTVMAQATAATLKPSQHNQTATDNKSVTSPDAAFVLYYGKYQTSAVKIKRVSQLVEARLLMSPEYEQLLTEMQQTYFNERASIMSPAVQKAIKELKTHHKGDHCALMRSACSFLLHVCQDEHRLFQQFFSVDREQLTVYLEGLCTNLYDTMRPFIIHINHLETLAEICSILRIEMLEEHVQQNPEPLIAFAQTVNQLLQDVQERLVFRAHLYLQSDILNYNPSAGDLAYPDKLEMMESIALSLQEPFMRRSDSRGSLVSTASSALETESVDTANRARNMNSPADLHGMWYPTVRRTLVCLSRLYRCVDTPIFQGLSQEALKLCIQSVSSAAGKISSAKSQIDGELFEIKHLLILREQIAPFRVDFTVKETSLDFSKVKTAAFGLLQKRKQLFSMGSNNALLEFLLDGTPMIKEHLLDSRKEVDRQLKLVCEQFIRDAGSLLIGPLIAFTGRAEALLSSEIKAPKEGDASNANYTLRQSAWASPQQISGIIQECQRSIKGKLANLQRSMQLYLSNRDTEFIIFRPIRNNIIQSFVKLEQLLTTNGYSPDDMTITSCPSAEQVSILLSSASILATEGVANFSAVTRKISTSSNDGTKKLEKKVSFDDARAVLNESSRMTKVPEVAESTASIGGGAVASTVDLTPRSPEDVPSSLHSPQQTDQTIASPDEGPTVGAITPRSA